MLNKVCARQHLTRRELRDLDIEISFLTGLVKRDPVYVEALQLLAMDFAQRGNFRAGLAVNVQLAHLRPSDPVALYNLACSYSLNRRLRLAADALNAAIECGYRDFRLLIKDPDLANLRKHPVFKRVRDKVRQPKTSAR